MQNLIILGLSLVIVHSITLRHDCGQAHMQPLFFECCPTPFIYDDATLSCICPPDTPLLSPNNTCSICPSDTHWDQQSASCVGCKGGRVYNRDLEVCMCPPQHVLNKAGECITC
uniref:Predicted protein n=1 Tax=Hordeum vulgare subsp. vulgare TaxID=112509 RepID=F2DTY1_HORVV|nr:predicted protein [Hordeum vulgare subsp. vulgare]